MALPFNLKLNGYQRRWKNTSMKNSWYEKLLLEIRAQVSNFESFIARINFSC